MKSKFLKVAMATVISLMSVSINVSARVNDVIDINVSHKNVYTVIEKSYSIDNGYSMSFKCPDDSISIMNVSGLDYRDLRVGDELDTLDDLQGRVDSQLFPDISKFIKPFSKQLMSVLAIVGVILSLFAFRSPSNAR